ncbi:MAG: hypothetical protein ABR520_07010 [Mycobacteriales bacterium]|nr:hypothetical protein [Frankia sp.]
MAVVVPTAGQSITAYADGDLPESDASLTVVVSEAEEVQAIGQASTVTDGPTGGVAACSDAQYSALGYTMRGTFGWYYNQTFGPANLNNLIAWYADGMACNGAWYLRGAATHEAGHIHGLGHVAEVSNGYQTMSAKLNGTCQISERTLGLGDINGLVAKYGRI